MSEKEFLKKFVNWMDSNGLIDNDATGDETFESFLTEFHKEYYEVEFIKKEDGIPI